MTDVEHVAEGELRVGEGAAARRHLGHAAALALVFATALVVRVYRIGEPPMDFHPTRQYRSALLARKYYFDHTPSIPAWRHELAVHAARERYEFPLLQYLAALGYQLRGAEDLRIPRMISVLAWLVGGIFIYKTARRLSTRDGALAATAFFLLLPFGVAASRAFHPDALMVALLALSWLTLLRYGEAGGAWLLLAAAGSGALATLVKPMAVFQVVGAFLAVWYGRRRRGDGPLLHAAIFALVVAVVGTSYYLFEFFASPYLPSVAPQMFIPRLLLMFAFWKGWLAQIWKIIGFAAPLAALIGYTMLPSGAARRLLLGAACGYVTFVLCFNYPGFTHDYYHLQLVPLVALGLAPLGSWAADRFRAGHLPAWLSANTALAAVFVIAVLDLGTFSYYREREVGFGVEVATYRQVGELVGHGSANVLLANYYAYPLKYYGEIDGVYWPLSFDARQKKLMGLEQPGAEERLAAMRAKARFRYFIVTDIQELHGQPDLERLLAAKFPVLAASNRYLIYDLERSAADTKAPR
jgi:hypothetical protein